MAWQFSWLERQPVTLEVVGSSPIQVAIICMPRQLSRQSRGLKILVSVVRFRPKAPYLKTCHRLHVYRDIQPRHKICWCGSTVEQLTCNQQVVGSIPITSSTLGGLQSGQMQRTVNPSSQTSMVRIHPLPPKIRPINGLFLFPLGCLLHVSHAMTFVI